MTCRLIAIALLMGCGCETNYYTGSDDGPVPPGDQIDQVDAGFPSPDDLDDGGMAQPGSPSADGGPICGPGKGTCSKNGKGKGNGKGNGNDDGNDDEDDGPKIVYGPAQPLRFESGDAFAYVGDGVSNQAMATLSDVEPALAKAYGGPAMAKPTQELPPPPIVYSSSDPEIAGVDGEGNVTTYSSGFVTITASQEGGDGSQSSASYDILVSFEVAAWVGRSDTELTFSEGADGVEMYRSTDPVCEIASILTCENGQYDALVSGEVFTDTALTTERPGYYTYVTAHGEEHFLPMATGTYTASSGARAVVWRDRMWLVGGDGHDGRHSEVWSSYDGINWILEVEHPGFTGRFRHGLVVHDDKLWVIGGYDHWNRLRDVWSSDDGQHWTEVTPEAPFGRWGHAAFAYAGRMWVVGGVGIDNTRKNDVWSSSDGANWTLEAAAAEFAPLANHRIVDKNGTLFMVDSWNGEGGHQVWSSTDAIHWTQVTADAGIPPRELMAIAAFEGKLWLVGGYSTNAHWNHYGDVWWSEDGATWHEIPEAEIPGRRSHQMVVFDHRLWVLAGSNKYSSLSDSWSTLDGVTWITETSEAGFQTRSAHAMASFEGRMWMMGGFSGSSILGDLWSSADGLSWQREPDPGFGTRLAPMVSFDGKLWLVGGMSADFAYHGDVWSSPDGQVWTQVSVEGPFGARIGHNLVVAGGRMWLLGGRGADRKLREDVWSSNDGVNWTLAVPNEEFTVNRSGMAFVGVGDTIYGIGGYVPFEGAQSDVWSTTNGADWNPVTLDGGFPARYQHQAISFGDSIYVIAGKPDSLNWMNSVWSSGDGGVTWTEDTSAAAFAPRSSLGAAVLGETMFVVGGRIRESSDGTGDVWASRDGATWRLGHRSVISF